MSIAPQTPQRPLPGAYFATPVASRAAPRSGLYPQPNGYLPQSKGGAKLTLSPDQSPPSSSAETFAEVAFALKTINDKLERDAHFPELDNYIGQGVSSEYDVPQIPAYAPYETLRSYLIPDQIFEQYNRAQVSTMMGIFAEINHAWVTIDNACYLWDYTNPNPDLVGFEEQPNSITAVRLVTPKPGVFVANISRLLVIATTVDMFLVGVGLEPLATGGQSLTLYQTRMSISVKGLRVDFIEASARTGRIFFAGRVDNELYEFAYQSEDTWFLSKCRRRNHTWTITSYITPQILASGVNASGQPTQQGILTRISLSKQPYEYAVQLLVDNSRMLLYTLSSMSTIRTFHITSDGGLELVITKTYSAILGNIGHMLSPNELLSTKTPIIAITAISSQEASKIHLMAVTSTGCRIYLSATSTYGAAITNPTVAPASMQVQHVRFPPKDPIGNQPTNASIDISSRALVPTRNAQRYPPGYFLALINKDPQHQMDTLFMCAMDAARIVRSQPSKNSQFCESGMWIQLDGRAEDIGLCTSPFSARPTPLGFGNEPAVQIDEPSQEFAILTNTGVHTYRRRRLVDQLAAAIKSAGGEEGLEGEITRFILSYGRSETFATVLGVACGQSMNLTSDRRTARVNDPGVLELARKAFIEYAGRPVYNPNSVVDPSIDHIDLVRPSPRHSGLALYVSRLTRSIWKAKIAIEVTSPAGGLVVTSPVILAKLREIQQDLVRLQDFLNTNKSFIEGLSGPEAMQQITTRQDQIALRGEHRAMHSIVVLLSKMNEGVSFVLVLFDERPEEIILSLTPEVRLQVRELTYEKLFCTAAGKDLAKELVKAIVNRNIASGSNVDTVAEALRRRCGSLCSSEDVVIFKAQEQLKKAAEAGKDSPFGRNVLNESLRLFKTVVANLSLEQLQWAMSQYVSLHFFGGAIELALSVASELDTGNRALSWIQDGRPSDDLRADIFNGRKRAYDLIHEVLQTLEQLSARGPTGQEDSKVLETRIAEAYNVVDSTQDEVFQTDLYDWYLTNNQADRLLRIASPYVISYLLRISTEDIQHADLLWRYYVQNERYHDAAKTQLDLAQSSYTLTLAQRIEYLTRAKANASTFTSGVGRQTRQLLLRQISDHLDVGQIQDELLHRLRNDGRMADEQTQTINDRLDGKVLGLTDLYNEYTDQADYHDLSLLIYHAADHRIPTDIRSTWQNLLETKHAEAVASNSVQPYELVAETVRTLGPKLSLSETVFPVADLIPMLERYAFEFQRGVGPRTWVLDIFLDLRVPHDAIFPVLEGMWYEEQAPWREGRGRAVVGGELLYVAQRWFHEGLRGAGEVFGGEAVRGGVSECLEAVMAHRDVEEGVREECRVLVRNVERLVR